MRIYPPVSKYEMFVYLKAQAKAIWGESPPVTEAQIDTLAEALSMISAVEVPEDLKPLFP